MLSVLLFHLNCYNIINNQIKTFDNGIFTLFLECPVQRTVNVKSRPRLPIPDDEDPYSVAGNNCISNENSDSSGYSGSSNSNSNGMLSQLKCIWFL